ncbi:Serine/Threonine-Protein Phosphatase 6 Regulatory Ankyrin Repeat Subunit A [Manis pentadactyla]|nr:Serine/Threonine-Protein Phosphatase 6 Regulatory Ankyrin Repeat Subunit A [Manis pentadactyla]
MTDVEANGIGSETLALRKELGFWSDVTGSARCLNRFTPMHMIRLRKEFGSNSDLIARGYVIDKGYGVDRDTFRFASYTDVRAKARLIFIIVVWHR